MKAKNFFLAVLMSITLSLSADLSFSKTESNSLESSPANSIQETNAKADYSEHLVFKDGIWWVYVYDGNVLVDIYPYEE